MSDIKVGTWNALNAFGDEALSPQRMHGALEVVKRMDADVRAIQEMARHGANSQVLENERLEEIRDLMGSAGIKFDDFTVHNCSVRRGGKPLSDHSPITAIARR